MYTPAMLAPVGKFKKKLTNIPSTKQVTEIIEEIIINCLKLFVNPFAITAGKTIKLEISKVPIIHIPRTTTKAVKKEIKN